MVKENRKESFGAYLKHLRALRGLTIRQVEEQTVKHFPDHKSAQVLHSYLTYLEKDKFVPPPPKLKALALVYGENYEFMLYKAGYLDRNPFTPMENLDVEALWSYYLQHVVTTQKTRPLSADESKTLRKMIENMVITMTGGK